MKRVAIGLVVMMACGGTKQPPPEQPGSVLASSGGGDAVAAPAVKLDTPEALSKAFLEALASADPARVRALYMTPEQVSALVTCTKDPVIELRQHLFEVEKKLKPISSKIEFEGWIEGGRSVLAAGTQRDGCTAKRDFELATGSVKYTMVSSNETVPDTKLIAIVNVDGTWRVWKLSSL
jgi:hypothetical protein